MSVPSGLGREADTQGLDPASGALSKARTSKTRYVYTVRYWGLDEIGNTVPKTVEYFSISPRLFSAAHRAFKREFIQDRFISISLKQTKKQGVLPPCRL